MIKSIIWVFKTVKLFHEAIIRANNNPAIRAGQTVDLAIHTDIKNFYLADSKYPDKLKLLS